MEFARRTTTWRHPDGSVWQVEEAVLDQHTFEPLARVTEPVGPFDELAPIQRGALGDAVTLARRQLVGQLSLEDLLPPPGSAGIA